MSPSNENISWLLALCEENPLVTGGIPLTEASDADFFMFSLICTWTNGWSTNWDTGDFRPIVLIMTSL